MKRTPLKRKTPLRSRTPLRRTSALKSRSPRPPQWRPSLILKTPGDTAFSLYIRTRDGWTCQRCGGDNSCQKAYYDCAHIFDRNAKSVRHDPENAAGLCRDCHRYLGANRGEHEAFFRGLLGDEAYDALEARAREHLPAMNRESDAEIAKRFRRMARELPE